MRAVEHSAENAAEVAAQGAPNPLLRQPQLFWHDLNLSDEDFLRVLTNATCPVVCVGYVNDTGWHLECEKRAREALAILRGWVKPNG